MERSAVGDTVGAREAGAKKEVIANWVGDNLYKSGFAQAIVAAKDKGLANKLALTMWNIRRGLSFTEKGRQTARLKYAEQLFMKAIENTARTDPAVELYTPSEPRGGQYSILELPNGKKYINVDVDQTLFDGLSDIEKLKMAELVIRERFVGKVIGDENHPAYVSKKTAKEYGHPAKFLKDSNIIDAKSRLSPELDDLLKVAYDWRNEGDGKGGHIHPKAVGGFDHATVLFKVGGTMYRSTINVEIIERGRLLKDITQIETATEGDYRSYETNSKPVSQGGSSNTNVPQKVPGVKDYSMQNGEKNSSSGQLSLLPPEMAAQENARKGKPDIYQEEGEREAYLAEGGDTDGQAGTPAHTDNNGTMWVAKRHPAVVNDGPVDRQSRGWTEPQRDSSSPTSTEVANGAIDAIDEVGCFSKL